MAFPKIPGMQPSRRVIETTGTHVTVGVTPPEFMRLREQQLTLTTDQYARYLEWLGGGVLIQDILPDLTVDQREVLLSGIGSDDFDALVGDDEDDENEDDHL